MRKIITITILFWAGIIAVFSQYFPESAIEREVVANSNLGYYIANGILYNGVYIYNQNRMEMATRVIIPKQIGHEGKVFSPDDIEEYGFENGYKYVSAKIEINGKDKSVFLEEILSVKDSLFFYIYCAEDIDDVFFILEGTKKLRQLNTHAPEEVWNIFLGLNDCSNIQGLKSFPKKLTRKRINVYYSAYKDCNPNLFPRFQYGPVVNLGVGKPKIIETPSYSYGFDLAFSVGGYFQLPFDECASLRTEILYSYLNNNRGQAGAFQKGAPANAQYIRHSIVVPVLVRYTFNFKPWKNVPYFEGGPSFDYSFNGGKFKGGVLQRPLEDAVLDDCTIIPFQYGVAIGAGIEHKISHKKSIHLGIRFNWTNGSRQEYEEKIQFLGINAAMNL